MDIRGTRWAGWKVQRLRIVQRVSTIAFAQKAGITRAALHNIERNLAVPSVETAARIAWALGVPISDLLE